MRKPLIVSIDPGTTIGYAVLDVHCNPLTISSLRHMSLHEILSAITEKGQPIIVATDKKIVPQLVQNAAVQVGAVVHSPKEDMLQTEKKELTDSYAVGNDHERDALASALHAYNAYKPLFQKVDKLLGDKIQYADEVKDCIVKNPGINIRLALELVQAKNANESQMLQRIVAKKPVQQDISHLLSKINKLADENIMLAEENNELKEHIRKQKRMLAGMEKRISQFNATVLKEYRIKQKDNVISSLAKTILREQNKSDSYKQQLMQLQEILLSFNEYMLLKKVSNLCCNNMSIKEDDILLVDNACIYSEKMIQQLNNKVTVIIHKNPVNLKIRKMLPFLFIPAENLHITEFEQYAFTNKKNFLTEKAKLDVFSSVLREFHRERVLELKA